jgi:hypothetical protein
MKPVAWMLNGKLHDCDPSDWAKEQYPDQDVIPLYTAPRELSDDEIWDVWSLLGERESRVIDFAKALLKKASEK